MRPPFAFAFFIPALIRSRISLRSNSAIAPLIWNMSHPLAVLKSRLSPGKRNALPKTQILQARSLDGAVSVRSGPASKQAQHRICAAWHWPYAGLAHDVLY